MSGEGLSWPGAQLPPATSHVICCDTAVSWCGTDVVWCGIAATWCQVNVSQAGLGITLSHHKLAGFRSGMTQRQHTSGCLQEGNGDENKQGTGIILGFILQDRQITICLSRA